MTDTAVPQADGQWLRRLVGSGEHTPASHPPLVALAREVLGPAVVDWAVDVGHEMTSTILADIPLLSGGEEAFQTVRMGTEASTLQSMLMLVSDDPATITEVPDESLEGDREFVRRRIPLEVVLHGIRLGHSIMARSLLEAASTVLDEPLRTEEMKRTSELLFRYMDEFASTMSTEYITEHDRWVTSAAAERAELVRGILDGQPVTVASASQRLGYPLERCHLAMVVWAEPGTGVDPSDLQRQAVRLLDGSGCTASLVIPFGASSVWVWSSWRTTPTQRPSLVEPELEGVHVTIGTPNSGTPGFRQSHREAERAAGLVRSCPGRSSRLTWFADVELAVLLSQDHELARAFVRRELGMLAVDSPGANELRETVTAYLSSDRSLARAAEILHVARNTVAYRVKKVEQELGRDLRERRLELECALRLASCRGAQLLVTEE